MGEKDLIELLIKKDPKAYHRLMELYAGMVYNTSLSIIQNVPDAEDITQEVFLEVFQSIHRFEQKSSLKTWIYRITITRSLDEVKKKRSLKRGGLFTRVFHPQKEGAMPDIPHFYHPGIELEQKENAAILFMAIDQLPPNQKTAFVLHKIEHQTHQEISEIMQISVSSVESLIFRARQSLKKLLEKYFNDRKV